MVDVGNAAPRASSLSKAAILVPLAILIGAPILGFVYAAAEIYIPIGGWITVILLGGFAYGLAWLVDQAARRSKCRDLVYVRAMGAASGVFGLYGSWVAFTYLLIQREQVENDVTYMRLFLDPALVFSIARSIAEVGWYSIASLTPAGTLIWILWGIEAAVIILVPALITGKFIGETAYCVDCDAWCTREAGLLLTGVPSSRDDRARVIDGDLAALAALPPRPKDLREPRVQIEFQSCPQCGESGGCSAFLLERTRDEDDKPKVKSTALRPFLTMSRADRDGLRKIRSGVDAEARAAATAR